MDIAEKDGRRIGAVLLKNLKITKAAVFIQESMQEPLSWLLLAHNTSLRNKIDGNLYSLAGILHLLISLWDILGVEQLYGHSVSLSQQPVQPRRWSVCTLAVLACPRKQQSLYVDFCGVY